MKTLAWFAAGIAVGIVMYLIANAPEPQYATGSDTLEHAARSAAGWGTKQRATGAAAGVLGRIKEGVGNLVDDPGLAGEGVADRIAGGVKEGAGKFAQGASQTLHDLNR